MIMSSVQDEAKKCCLWLSIIIIKNSGRAGFGGRAAKSNILMLGRRVRQDPACTDTCEDFKCSFAIADATALTEAGYVGEDVENILLKVIQAADGDVERAEHGIIYIDEIDKITRKSENPSITRDVIR